MLPHPRLGLVGPHLNDAWHAVFSLIALGNIFCSSGPDLIGRRARGGRSLDLAGLNRLAEETTDVQCQAPLESMLIRNWLPAPNQLDSGQVQDGYARSWRVIRHGPRLAVRWKSAIGTKRTLLHQVINYQACPRPGSSASQ